MMGMISGSAHYYTALLMIAVPVVVMAVQGPPAKPAPIPPPPDVAAPPKDATTTPSGLAFKVLQPGTGTAKPAATDIVTVHYTGWTTDGTMFDSSHSRNATATFPLDRVIKGWGEGVQLMVAGEKRRLWIPQTLAYNGQAGRPAGMLVFDIELLELAPSPRVAPPDVAAAPADAKRTASGLAYKVLKAGTGTEHPRRESQVTVHYTGWQTNGRMFDSSVERGAPTSFGLGDVIPGWTEGVQLMVVGEKTRFWIPQDLAYKGQSGSPSGMLVFDVELIAIR
jgi:peptidylprolyl isomerase